MPKEFEATKHSFLSECFKASRILHPNVVQMLGDCYPTPEAWLVMELMDTTLKCFLAKYNNEKVSSYSCCWTLHKDHAQDIAHRDLFSNNVFLTKQLALPGLYQIS